MSNELYQKEQPIIRILVFLVEIASKLEKVGPTFSSLISIHFHPCNLRTATNDRKQIQHHNIVVNNKPRPLLFNSVEGKTYLGFQRNAKIA